MFLFLCVFICLFVYWHTDPTISSLSNNVPKDTFTLTTSCTVLYPFVQHSHRRYNLCMFFCPQNVCRTQNLLKESAHSGFGCVFLSIYTMCKCVCISCSVTESLAGLQTGIWQAFNEEALRGHRLCTSNTHTVSSVKEGTFIWQQKYLNPIIMCLQYTCLNYTKTKLRSFQISY